MTIASNSRMSIEPAYPTDRAEYDRLTTADRKLTGEFLRWGITTRRWRQDTVDNYRQRTAGWLNYLRRHDERPRRATTLQVRDYLDGRYRLPASRDQVRNTLVAFYDYLMDRGSARDNPARAVERCRKPRSMPRSLSAHEVATVLATADAIGGAPSVLVRLFAYCGLRRDEVRRLEWADVERHDDGLWLRVVGKGGHLRDQPLHPHVASAVTAWEGPCESARWLFPSPHRGDQPICRATVNGWLQRIAARADVHVTPHLLRHSYAARLVEQGVPLPVVMDALGHSELSSTTIYTRSRPHQVREAVGALTWTAPA